MITLSCHQAELHDTERELSHLMFRAEVVNKEKELLTQFADHVRQGALYQGVCVN